MKTVHVVALLCLITATLTVARAIPAELRTSDVMSPRDIGAASDSFSLGYKCFLWPGTNLTMDVMNFYGLAGTSIIIDGLYVTANPSVTSSVPFEVVWELIMTDASNGTVRTLSASLKTEPAQCAKPGVATSVSLIISADSSTSTNIVYLTGGGHVSVHVAQPAQSKGQFGTAISKKLLLLIDVDKKKVEY